MGSEPGAVFRRLATRLSRRASRAEPEPIRLGRRRIFILPTATGVLFAVVLTVMLIGALNYNNNLGLGFTFLLASTALVAMLHAHRNLLGLRIRSAAAAPVFAGGVARFELRLQAPKPPDRAAIALQADGQPPVVNAVPATPGNVVVAALSVPAPQRGLLALGRCRVFTDYPLGLFRAWSWIHPGLQCVVYPRPEPGTVPPVPSRSADSSAAGRGGAGREDFQGLRAYRMGDSWRHLAWKAAPLGPVPYTKQFEGNAGGDRWLEWDRLAGLDPEARLSRLCRWVLDSQTAGYRYGLRLPGVEIELGTGEPHKHRCLEALARFEVATVTIGDRP